MVEKLCLREESRGVLALKKKAGMRAINRCQSHLQTRSDHLRLDVDVLSAGLECLSICARERLEPHHPAKQTAWKHSINLAIVRLASDLLCVGVFVTSLYMLSNLLFTPQMSTCTVLC